MKLTSVLKYARINAKVRAMRRHLFDRDRLYALLGSRDLKGVLHLLEDTLYKSDAHRILEEMTPTSVEQVLMENFVKTVEDIIKLSPSRLRIILRDTLQRFEASNLKLVLRAKQSGLRFSEIRDQLLPLKRFGRGVCKLLLEKSEKIDDLVNLLETSPYGEAFKQSLEEYRLRGTLLPLETALDKRVYQLILDNAYKPVSYTHLTLPTICSV